MNPSRPHVRLSRRILRDRVDPQLEAGDVMGGAGIAAAKRWITWSFKGSPTPARWVAAVIQKESAILGIDAGSPDAFYGPQTADAADRIIALSSDKPAPSRPDEESDEISSDTSSVRCWSPTTAQFNAAYGEVGTNQDMVLTPYPLQLDWDLSTSVSRFSAHKSLVPRIQRAMVATLAHYGIDGLRNLGLHRFGGCLYVRNKRGGSTPSVHSWGAAVDWYPTKNQLRQKRTEAVFGREAYDPFLDAWEAQGFMSLGRCYDFDWMHLQANP